MEAIHGEKGVADLDTPAENLALELLSLRHLLDISKEMFRRPWKMGNRVLEMDLSERSLKCVRGTNGARREGLNESLMYLSFKYFWQWLAPLSGAHCLSEPQPLLVVQDLQRDQLTAITLLILPSNYLLYHAVFVKKNF